MVDNVSITPGSGAIIAADDVSSALYQRVKLVDSTDGSADAMPTNGTWGLHVRPGIAARLSQTPTISTSIYAAGDAVGGLLTFSNAARTSAGGLRIKQVIIVDKDAEMAPMTLALFDRIITPSSDNAVFDPTDADLANLVALIPIGTYTAFNDNAIGRSADLDIPVKLTGGPDMFGQLSTHGTPTYTATSDIIIIVSVIQE